MKPRTLSAKQKSRPTTPRPQRLRGEIPAATTPPAPLHLRDYQQNAFDNRTNGIELWLWGRQTGKSFTLAAWAIDRLLTRPGRLVTILSNSLANGAELNQKCAQVAHLYQQALGSAGVPRAELGVPPNSPFATNQPFLIDQDLSHPIQFDCMNYETRVTIGGQTSRIKILPANPRTARGFSGDLILDEFAFHENSTAIWEAAEPILSAHPDYLCRIASTPNGRHNMFYRLVTDPAIFKRIVPRSEAWRQGLQIFHPTTRQPITPFEARALAHDKRAYDQNYECIFESENMALLSHELISAAEDPTVGLICDDQWSEEALATISPDDECRSANGNPVRNSNFALRNYYVGVDVGRHQDLTVISVVEKQGDMFYVRAMLRLRNVRLPQQQELLEVACRSPRFAGAQIDMTGLGLGLYEYTRQKYGDRIRGLNFASSIPLSVPFGLRTSKFELSSAKAPEVLALRLLQVYESKRIRHPVDSLLREDLRKPERITTPEGRVSIVASRGESGHADHFWSLALAIDAALRQPEPYIHVVEGLRPERIPRDYVVI
jgi:phage FluMu gp28-like protein